MNTCTKVRPLISILLGISVFTAFSISDAQGNENPVYFYKNMERSMLDKILNTINASSSYSHMSKVQDFPLSSDLETELTQYFKDISETYSSNAKSCKIRNSGFSSAYLEALNNAHFSSTLLSKEQYDRLRKIKGLLFDTSDKASDGYANYLHYRSKLEEVRERIGKIPPIQRTPTQNLELRQAIENLLLLGGQSQYEPMHNELLYLSRLQNNDRKDSYLRRYVENLSNDRSVKLITWSEYSKATLYQRGEIVLNIKDRRPSWVPENLEIKFEWSTIEIKRPWLALEFFGDNSFKLEGVLSDGAGGGMIGSYISSILVVKNIEIEIRNLKEYMDALNFLSRNNSSFYFGFIPVYKKDVGPALTIMNNGTLKYNGVIAIACKTSNLPKSPNPNPSVFW